MTISSLQFKGILFVLSIILGVNCTFSTVICSFCPLSMGVLGIAFSFQVTNAKGLHPQLLNPFTPNRDQSKNSRKIPIYIFANSAKQIAPCKSTAKEITFEWSHHRILSTGSNIRLLYMSP